MTKEAGRVFCIGETVLDIIFREDQPLSATPGGSMLNSAVSLGRAGTKVFFISDFGTDHPGNIIQEFLSNNGVSTEYVSRYSNGKTSLALAFLDQQKNADYSFYKILPEERLICPFPGVEPGDIVLFGSIYAITNSLRSKITGFVRAAKAGGAFIIYDPNFRSAHLGELETVRPWIMENMGMANLVRGSDEDFKNIFNAPDAQQAFRHVHEAGCPLLVYTKSSKGVEVIQDGVATTYRVPQIEPVSTIGAGDAFNAGIIHAATTLPGTSMLPMPGTLPAWLLDCLIESAIRFSADVCLGLDNYISPEFGNNLKNKP
ncbi:MAG: PfkB family carbohydrate kinase [Bacteroidetes bacterium]|nr:PfkB family carbohydrate kinase [Bacteroidota bacterium]